MFILHYTFKDSFIWTSNLWVAVPPLSLVSLVFSVSFLICKICHSPASCSHFLSLSIRKEKTDERAVILAGWWIQPAHTWSGWWTMVREGYLQKPRACEIFAAPTESFKTDLWSWLSVCVEVKPWGWTWNSWGPHETWSTPHCALPFLFGHLTFTPAVPLSAQHSCSPTFSRLRFIQSSSWKQFLKPTSLSWCDTE